MIGSSTLHLKYAAKISIVGINIKRRLKSLNIKVIIMKLKISAILAFLLVIGGAYAQTASILPPAKTTFVDQNGKPLTGGKVEFYIPGTSNLKATWQDAARTILNTNPVVLDAAGRAIILGFGSYRQVVKDRNNNIIWDQITSNGADGGGGTTVGDGNQPGVVIPWAGLIAPVNYAFTYGQELSRTTYATLLKNITITQSLTCNSGNPVLINIADTSQLNIGAKVEASCVPANSIIIAKTSSTVSLNKLAIVSTTATGQFFPWGNGNGSTTFNIPDLRGVVLPGRNNMGGATSSVLTSTYYTDPNALGGSGGSQSATIINANLPPYTPAGTITNGAVTISPSSVSSITSTATSDTTAGSLLGSYSSASLTASQAASTFTGTAAAGHTSTPFSIIQPSKTINYIIKLTADVSLAVASCTDLIDDGTACQANTGTSGHTLPFLDTANNWSLVQTFASGFQVSGLAAKLAGNPTAANGPMTDFSIQSLTLKGTVNANNDFLLLWDSVTNSFKKVTPGQLASGGAAGVSSLGGQTGALSCGGAVTCAASTVSVAALTGDTPPSAGIAGVAPAPASGDTGANRILGASATWVDRKPLYAFAVPTPFQSSATVPTLYALAPVPVWSSGTSGPGSVKMSIRPDALFSLIVADAGSNSSYAYVDPVNGTNTGSTCAQATPCKTLEYCFQQCTATNIVGIPTGKFNPFTWDALITVNKFHRLSFTGPATIKLTGTPYIDTSAMTFTADGVAPAVYVATLTLTGAQAVQRVVRNITFNVGTGDQLRLPQYPSLAALRTASNAASGAIPGWFYDSATGNYYVTYFGSNISLNKSSYTTYYVDDGGNSSITLNGDVTLSIYSPYPIYLEGVALDAASSDSVHHPILLIDGGEDIKIRQFVSPILGTRMRGGFLYVAGMDCEASRFDCWNLYPPVAGSTVSYSIGNNIRGWFAGDLQNYALLSPTPNNQGWSAHGGANDIVAGASFGQNYGQALANISNDGYNSYSWLIGVETYLSGDATVTPGINIVSNDGVSTRTAWIDTCSTQEATNSIMVQVTGAVGKITNCAVNVPVFTNAGGIIQTYVRNAP